MILRNIYLAALLICMVLPLPARAAQAATADCAAPPPVVTRQPTQHKRLALTFDADAFVAGTDDILDALQARNAQATFFLTGTWMRNNPALVRRMLAEGHQVTTHGNTHVDFRQLSDAQIRAQLQAAEAELNALGGAGHPYVRLPSDAFNGRVLRVLCQQGYQYIFWALDVRDAVGQPKSADYVYNRLVNHLAGDAGRGAVVLLHLGKPGTTAALPQALDFFARQGYSFMTVHDLLSAPEQPPASRRFTLASSRVAELDLFA